MANEAKPTHPNDARIRELAREICLLITAEEDAVQPPENQRVALPQGAERRVTDGPRAGLARSICWDILEAAQADGVGGCLLCQS